jgi:hypothetical protein
MPDVGGVFSSAMTDFGAQLLTIAAGAIGVGILVLGLTRGWGLVKRFTK